MTDREIVASLPARKPEYAALPGTTDTHFHIFESTHRYPLSPARMYDPALSTVGDYLAMAETIGIQRMVVVQASIYGTDNRCLLDSIPRLGARRTRGIAVVDQSITLDALKEMDRQGVRGIRFNAITGRTPVEWLPSLARLIEPLGWHIQLWTNSARLTEIDKVLDDVPTPVVLDHMGQFPVEEGVAGAQFQNILRRLDSGRFWVKLIGYRVSKSPPTFEDDLMAPAKALLGAAPERCLWGTDWPHIFLEGRPMPDTTALFDLAWRWFSPPVAQLVFVDNPARLYGFG